MNSTGFITNLEDSLNVDEILAVSILSVPSFLNDSIAKELLELDILSSSNNDLFSKIQCYPIWKRRSENSWIIENDIRNVFLKKLNGNSQSIIESVYKKLEDFRPNLIQSLNTRELKDFYIQISRLSLALPDKQEDGIQLFRSLYDISETYKIHTTSELIYKYLEDGLKIDVDAKELPSYILNALFMKGMYAYNKRKYDEALKYLTPVWQNHDNSILSLKDAGIASHIIGLIWSKKKYRFEEIKEAFDSSIKIRIEVGDQIGLAQTYHSLGNLYSSRKMLPEAEWAYNESLKLDLLNDNQNGVAQVHHSLGNLFSQFSAHFDKAEKNYKKSIPILKSEPDNYGLAQVYHSLANLLAKIPDRFIDASKFYENSIKLGHEVGIKRHLAQVYMNYGIMQMKNNNYPEALKLLTQSLQFEKKDHFRLKISALIDKIKTTLNKT
ncbi:hypothetical protein DNU06_15540 [Putridiphycobacter roseus]|uniref:Uncharacterized protein n=1 Tax=Putridiphycobacter roseus TaxID=2219161 RepID=A0A2W1MXL9_9FLAO|nr:tetratricopeptide repeat protein [Putridiphycobacter roseus]PZE15920.1 hypothetical protein DNU06_15540 [Putridiphycobacter roseus]